MDRYAFDPAGNRIEKTTDTYVEQYRYDERNRMVESERQDREGDRPGGTTRYLYDAQGSLLLEEGPSLCRKYLYNDFHQCVTAEVVKRCGEEAGKRAVQENLYDGDGLRTDFVTNGWENLAELDEAGEVKKRIIRGVGIVASEEDHAYHYYHGNERRDVELITDEQGGICSRYRYDAFGGITESEEGIGNRYTYNGEAYDRLTGQYYLRKRFYNPAVCRFTQEDEYRGDGLNLYAFCANNPVRYVDPSGYSKCVTSEADEGKPKRDLIAGG